MAEEAKKANDTQTEDDGSTTEVVSTEGESTDELLEKADEHKISRQTLITIIVALVVVVTALVGYVLYTGESPDDVANQDSSDGIDANEGSELSVEDIEERVRRNQQIWSSDLETLINEFDAANDNVAYTFSDDELSLMSNGLPDHETGQFPNANNPNSISEQDADYIIPRAPAFVGTATDVRVTAVTLGGVPMEPGTAETDQTTGWSIEAFNISNIFNPGVDDNNAHVQPNGTYHYHGLPQVLVTAGEGHSNILGFAADGFPIYGDHGYRDPTNPDGPVDHMTSSWRLKEGMRAAGEPAGPYNGDYTQDYEYIDDYGDLDECNGRFTVTPDFPNGTYAYFMSGSFPYIGRCVMGEVLDSFNTAPLGPAPGGQQLGPPPRM